MLTEENRSSSELFLDIEVKKAPGETQPSEETCKVDTQSWESHLLQVMVSINKSQTSGRPNRLCLREAGEALALNWLKVEAA